MNINSTPEFLSELTINYYLQQDHDHIHTTYDVEWQAIIYTEGEKIYCF